tara:strand:+ start:2409 stop:4283 length:1875 start_codon:yes stop_codon:yes gene_type:complete
MIGKTNQLSDFIEAAGLLAYDPAAISEIYKNSPYRLIKRIWQTLVPIGLFLFGVGIDKAIGLLKDEKQVRLRAKEFADLLVKLGPAFIKAGQALSTRPDIVPPLVLEELAQLQDQLPGFSSDMAMACIEEDLGKPINKIYKYLDIHPISAASLGQVHKGELISGEKVAVKIQRPGLREQITLDLYIVRNLAKWVNNNIKLIRSDLVALIDELGRRVFEEMDYMNEAANAVKFKKLHIHNNKIAVPKIYKEATSRRILTMEWIDGVKLTNIEQVKAIGIDPDEMIEIGVNCSLQQLLEHGFFHADPHPGNLLALSDGRLCYLDFGMMSEITRESRTGLIQAVVHLVNKNFNRLSEDFIKLGFLSEDVKLDPIVPAFQKVFEKAIDQGVNKMDFKSVTDDLSGVMYKLPFRVPAYYALIIRSLVTLEGIALSVDPNFKILGASYPYFAKRLMEDPDPALRKSLKEMVFDGNIFQWDRFEDLFESAARETNLNIDNLIDQLINYIFSNQGVIIRQELVDLIAKKIDNSGWKIIKKINGKLPKKFRSKRVGTLDKILEKNGLKIRKNATIKSSSIIKKIPGFKIEIILKQIPRILREPYTLKMSIQIFKRLSERSIIRIVKVAAGVQQ